MKSCDCCVVRLEILVTCQMNSYSCEMKSHDCCDSYKICDCVMKFMMAGAMERKKMRKEKNHVHGTKSFSYRPVLKDPFSTGRFGRY